MPDQHRRDPSGRADQLPDLDVQGEGESAGVPAAGQLEGQGASPLGDSLGLHHWQEARITRAGLEDRGDVFFAAVEMTRMPMVVTDPNKPDNPIVFCNRAFLDLTGYGEEEALGRNCRFLQGPGTDPETVAEVRAAVEGRRAVAVDILNYKRDGTPFWNALFIGPILDADGELLYFFSSQMDITRRRETEQGLRQAQKMEAIGQLTAGLAHDFNNLLQVVCGNIEMASDRLEADPAAARRALANADRAAQQGARLTQQLLAFARKQRLEPRRVNLNALVLEVAEMLARTLGETVDLRLDLRPGLADCQLDPVHLEMALLNILVNARDAMPGGGKVTVATSRLELDGDAPARHLDPGGYVVLCVHDEGGGMPPEVLRRAAEPFFTTKPQGTGLGLAMAHGFAQQSGGRLEVESTLGQGTLVRFLFPVARVRPAAAPAAAGDGGTVLVVEDNDDARALAAGHLRTLGYRVLEAADGESALDIVRREPALDLLLTDLVMPGGINGLVLAERARQRFPGLPVVLATGDEDPGAGGRDPAIGVLHKPYRRAELAARVREALAGK